MENMLFSQKDYSFIWEAPFQKTRVRFEIPSLKMNKFNCGGDWGPSYEFALKPTTLPCITYTDLKTKVDESYHIEENILKLESPMNAIQREHTPLFYTMKDQSRNISFKLYVDRKFELAKVIITRLTDGVELYSSEIEVAA